jgi:hypothetical protein
MAVPTSAAIQIFSTRSPSGVSATCTISPTQEPKERVKAKPLAFRAGRGSPHRAISATRSTTATAVGCAAISLRRIATGSSPPFTAISSMKPSWKKPLKELPTDRQKPTGTPRSALAPDTR